MFELGYDIAINDQTVEYIKVLNHTDNTVNLIFSRLKHRLVGLNLYCLK